MTQIAASFLDKVKTSMNSNIFLVKGSAMGMNCWYYVLVDKNKLIKFKAEFQTKKDDFNLTDYGTILKSGWGQEPAPYIQQKMEREGVNYSDAEFHTEVHTENRYYYVLADDAQGRLFYNYLLIPADKIGEFLKVSINGGCDMADYGKVIEKGWGEPSEELKQRMREMGFRHPEDAPLETT